MGTHCWILLKGDDEIKGIYCHYDGYFEHAGKILKTYYTNHSIVEKLIELGDISVLYESIEQPKGHSFSTPVPGHTIAYHRDRGEEFRDISISNPYAEHEISKLVKYLKEKARKSGVEYVYLFELKSEEWLSFRSD